MQIPDYVLTALSRLATHRGVSSNQLLAEIMEDWTLFASARDEQPRAYTGLAQAAVAMRGAGAAPQPPATEQELPTVEEVQRAAGGGIFDAPRQTIASDMDRSKKEALGDTMARLIRALGPYAAEMGERDGFRLLMRLLRELRSFDLAAILRVPLEQMRDLHGVIVELSALTLDDLPPPTVESAEERQRQMTVRLQRMLDNENEKSEPKQPKRTAAGRRVRADRSDDGGERVIGAAKRYRKILATRLMARKRAGGPLSDDEESRYIDELDRCWREMTDSEQAEIVPIVENEPIDAPAPAEFARSRALLTRMYVTGRPRSSTMVEFQGVIEDHVGPFSVRDDVPVVVAFDDGTVVTWTFEKGIWRAQVLTEGDAFMDVITWSRSKTTAVRPGQNTDVVRLGPGATRIGVGVNKEEIVIR